MSLSKQIYFPQEKIFPIFVQAHNFHVTKPDTRGHNCIYDSRRSKSYFFELDFSKHRSKNCFNIYMNDQHVDKSCLQYPSTCRSPNKKFRTSLMLSHFFKIQKVIPKRVQHKYFNFIRDKLLERSSLIENRATSTTKNNNSTKTFFKFSYKKYRFHFGVLRRCIHHPNEIIPTPVMRSRHRATCPFHEKMDIRAPKTSAHTKLDAATNIFNKWYLRDEKLIVNKRLGISYKTFYSTIKKNSSITPLPANLPDRIKNKQLVYMKHYSDYKILTEKDGFTKKTVKKQSLRRARLYSRKLKDAAVHPDDEEKVVQTMKQHHFLCDKVPSLYRFSQHLTKRSIKKFDCENDLDPYYYGVRPHYTIEQINNYKRLCSPSDNDYNGFKNILYVLDAERVEESKRLESLALQALAEEIIKKHSKSSDKPDTTDMTVDNTFFPRRITPIPWYARYFNDHVSLKWNEKLRPRFEPLPHLCKRMMKKKDYQFYKDYFPQDPVLYHNKTRYYPPGSIGWWNQVETNYETHAQQLRDDQFQKDLQSDFQYTSDALVSSLMELTNAIHSAYNSSLSKQTSNELTSSAISHERIAQLHVKFNQSQSKIPSITSKSREQLLTIYKARNLFSKNRPYFSRSKRFPSELTSTGKRLRWNPSKEDTVHSKRSPSPFQSTFKRQKSKSSIQLLIDHPPST